MADTVSFDAGQFDQLIKFITDGNDQLTSDILAPSSGLLLDAALRTYLKPGSPQWLVVQSVLSGGGTFGEAVDTRLTALGAEWTEFARQLTQAKAIFTKSDDLATVSASEFLAQFPGLAPPAPPVAP
jgi:hypothetical protein